MKYLNVLGFYPERLNILLELANNALGTKHFRVLENMVAATPEHYISSNKFKVTFYSCHEERQSFNPNENYAFGVIGTKSKEAIFTSFKEEIGYDKSKFTNLIHSTSYVSESAKLQQGIQIGMLAAINVLAEIGFGVNIKTKCYIGHHAKIGNYVTINPGVIISGFVEIGNNSLIGAGAMIRDGVRIGSNCLIGMGSNVVKDIPDNSVAFGNPCKVVRENK